MKRPIKEFAIIGGSLAVLMIIATLSLRPSLIHSLAGMAVLMLLTALVPMTALILVKIFMLSPLEKLDAALAHFRDEELGFRRLESVKYGHIEPLAVKIDSLIDALLQEQGGRRLIKSRLRTLFDGDPVGLVLAKADGTFIEFNNAMSQLTGYTCSEIPRMGTLIQRLCANPVHREVLDKVAADMLAGKEISGTQLLILTHQDSTPHDVLFYAISLGASGDHTIPYMLGFVDVSWQRQVEEGLILLQRAIEAIPLGFTITDTSGRILYTNHGEASMHGRTVTDLIGKVARILAPRDLWNPISIEQICSMRPLTHESLNIRTDDTTFPVNLVSNVIRNTAGQPVALVTSCEDITERKKSEQMMRENLEHYQDLVDHTAVFMCTHDPDGILLSANMTAARLLGYSLVKNLIGRSLTEFFDDSAKEDFVSYLESVRRDHHADGVFRVRLAGGKSAVLAYNTDLRHESPLVFRMAAHDITETLQAMLDLKKTLEELHVLNEERTREIKQLNEKLLQDASRRQRVEAALGESERRFKTFFEDAPIGIYRTTREGRIIMANTATIHMLGCSSFDELAMLDLEKMGFGPATRKGPFHQQMESEGGVSGVESTWVRGDEGNISVCESARVIKSADGEVICLQGVVEDITHRKSLEDQLRQSLKMDALGRLAGGVAHDFNNILTGILGYSDLMLMRLHEGDPLRRNADEIKRAAERAANLTRQLLAFSRRQIMQPKVLDLNTIVTDMEHMLRRLMSEDLLLVTKLEPNLGKFEADPGQIEQVILNLAVNARDAMPNGGVLTITTATIQAEDSADHISQVKLMISDTGCGMSPEVKAHIFEPFFTTKQRGTGLGLSTVYGIICQSKGIVHVLSEVGVGTTFEVFLPMVEKAQKAEAPMSLVTTIARGEEIVLLVEDDEVVRKVTCEALELNGYVVLVAPHGEQALATSASYKGRIHIMVTDIVMPGINGRELAKRLAPQRPDMRILYISGYTDDQITHQGILNEGIEFLQKPFTPTAFVRKVQEVLGSQQNPPEQTGTEEKSAVEASDAALIETSNPLPPEPENAS